MTGKAIDTRIGTRQDYAALARLADEYNVSYLKLAAKFEERGLSPDEIRAKLEQKPERIQPDETWITTAQADAIAPGFRRGAIDSAHIRTRRRAHRGPSVLWHSRDIKAVADIAKTCAIKPRAAVRVFDALPFPIFMSKRWISWSVANFRVPRIADKCRQVPGAIRTRDGAWYDADVQLTAHIIAACRLRVLAALRVTRAWRNDEL